MEQKTNVSMGSIILEPGVGSSYGNGWRQLWKYFLELFLILIISWVLGLPGSLIGWLGGPNPVASLFVFIYTLLVLWPVGYGVSFAYLKAARGDRLEIKDIFAAFQNFWNAVLANLLVAIIIGIGLIFIIIPGIFFACKLAFTPYLVVDRQMDVIEAIRTSWRMTGGHGWKVFLIGLLGIPIFIAGLICFGIGAIISVMWISMAMASLYHAVSTSACVPESSGAAIQEPSS